MGQMNYVSRQLDTLFSTCILASMRPVCLLLALLISALASAAEPPQNPDTLYFTLRSWKGMTFSVNIRGEEVLYRCALNGDETLTRWAAFKADNNDVRRLFSSLEGLNILYWPAEFSSTMLDGEGWHLSIHVGGRSREIFGSNAQPDELPAVVDHVAHFLGKLPFGFSGVVPHTKDAENCLLLKQPLRNYVGTARRPQ
jgi:hypothetical protein